MIRIGLMGCGNVAGYGHLPAIKKTRGLELRSLFEPDPLRLQEANSRYSGAIGFLTPEAFFESDIDAVVITSPAPTHLQNVLLAAKHKKPVLCEKPLAMTESESEQMIEAMDAAGVPLYLGFTYRFSPCALEIRRLVQQGAIGTVRSLRLVYLWDCHGFYNPRTGSHNVNAHRAGRMLEGGPMVDCGVHQIDLARWWLGSEIKRAHAHGVWVDEQPAPDHLYLHMDHENGTHTMVEMSYSYAHTSREARSEFVYELIGTEGLIRYDRQARVFEMVNRTATKTLDWHGEKNFDGMYVEFEKSLRTTQTGDMPTARDGLIATRIARSATEQVMQGRASK